MKILFIDDDPTLSHNLKVYFQEAGFVGESVGDYEQALEKLKAYQLGKAQPPQLPGTRIQKSQALNRAFSEFSAQIEQDYASMKAFTENASHEIQTPLAAALTDLDLMIQEETLTEKQAGHLRSAYTSLNYLRKLNQGLLLLAKIENRQFSFQKNIDPLALFKKSKERYEGLAVLKNIIIKCIDQASFLVEGSSELLSILMDNLVKKQSTTQHPVAILRWPLNREFLAFLIPENPSVFLLKNFSTIQKGNPGYRLIGVGIGHL